MRSLVVAYILSFRRIAVNPSIVLLIFLTALFSARYTPQVEYLPCGIYIESDADDTVCRTAARLLSYTKADTQFRFRTCSSKEELKNAVSLGELDCGVIFPANLKKTFESFAESSGSAAVLIVSESSLLSDVYSQLIISELFYEYAPYVTESSLAASGVEASVDELREIYLRYFETESPFEFDIIRVDSEKQKAADSLNLCIMLIGVLIYSAMTATVKHTDSIALRLERGKYFSHVLLPELISRALLYSFAAAAGFAAAALSTQNTESLKLIVPLMIYALLVSVCSFIIRSHIIIFPFTLLSSLIICPIFVDISAFLSDSPALSALRAALAVISPPYWFFSANSYPVVFAILTAAVYGLLWIYHRCKPLSQIY